MERIKWVDVAKGLCILLVVAGHTGIPVYLVLWIFSFHMPFFFFISGFLYNNHKYTPIQFIFKRVKSLLLPYAIFSAIVILLMPIYASHEVTIFELPSIAYDVFCHGWASDNYTYPLWFIPVLFVVEVVYMLLCRLPNIIKVICIILLGLLGIVLYWKNISFVYTLPSVCTAIVFYYLGNLMHVKISSISIRRLKTVTMITLFLLAFVISILVSQYNLPQIDLAYNQLSNPILMYIAAIAGIIIVILTSMIIISKSRVLTTLGTYFGKNTYVILATHVLYMQLLIRFLGNGNSFLRHLCMWILMILTIYCINNYVPWILGEKRVYEK